MNGMRKYTFETWHSFGGIGVWGNPGLEEYQLLGLWGLMNRGVGDFGIGAQL